MSNDQDEMVTQPMVETVLERLQGLETRLESKLLQASGATASLVEQLSARVEQLSARVEQQFAILRAEMNENFSRVRDEIAILNEDTLKTRAGQRELLRRIEELESKAS